MFNLLFSQIDKIEISDFIKNSLSVQVKYFTVKNDKK